VPLLGLSVYPDTAEHGDGHKEDADECIGSLRGAKNEIDPSAAKHQSQDYNPKEREQTLAFAG
jgi:hypothetical protein